MGKPALAPRLKELRIKNHYTQSYVSSQLNIGRSAYSNYELGKREPPLELILDFSNFYQVSVDYLVRPEIQDPIAATVENPFLSFSRHELKFLSLYRSLSKEQRKELWDFASFLKSRHF